MPKSVRGVLDEFKHGQLHSGSSTGKVVTKRSQALAIALSEQRQMKKKKPDVTSYSFNNRDRRRRGVR